MTCRTLLAGSGHSSTYSWAEDAAQRARRAGAQVVHVFDRAVVFERDLYRCYLCGVLTDPTLGDFDRRRPTVDHVVPLTRGGDHTLANVRCACLSCNSAKKDQLVGSR